MLGPLTNSLTVGTPDACCLVSCLPAVIMIMNMVWPLQHAATIVVKCTNFRALTLRTEQELLSRRAVVLMRASPRPNHVPSMTFVAKFSACAQRAKWAADKDATQIAQQHGATPFSSAPQPVAACAF